MDPFDSILAHPADYRLQIIYTQVDRDSLNNPSLRSYSYRADKHEYFYPASMVKLPGAILALEKLNELDIDGLDRTSPMFTDSAYSRQTTVIADSTSENGLPSLGHYIKKVFLVSDNDAYNRLYEFLGQEELNERLWNKGYTDVRLTHRLSVFFNPEENRCTNPVRFSLDDGTEYKQPLQCYDSVIQSPIPILLGQGEMVGDSVEMHPKDFSRNNFVSLENLHEILINVIFPGISSDKEPFRLNEEDYDFLRTYMSMLPRESDFPHYGDKYPDNYCKFLIYADRQDTIPANIRIFNKVGLAYGFLVESAYIIDFDTNVEFFLSAVISVNRNRVYNDGVYEYDSVGYPFLGSLGRAFLQYEQQREREFVPDLSEFKYDY